MLKIRGLFVEHKLQLRYSLSVTQFVTNISINMVTLCVQLSLAHINQTGLLCKSLSLAAALSATQYVTNISINMVTLCVLLKYN
jgi:hypothetical protein